LITPTCQDFLGLVRGSLILPGSGSRRSDRSGTRPSCRPGCPPRAIADAADVKQRRRGLGEAGRGESVPACAVEDLPPLALTAVNSVDRGVAMVAATPTGAPSGSRRGARRGRSRRQTARGRAAGAAGAAVVAVALLAVAGRARERDGEGSGTVPSSGRAERVGGGINADRPTDRPTDRPHAAKMGHSAGRHG